MKNAYLITNTAYKMLNQASFLEIMYIYMTDQIHKTKIPIKVISTFKKMCFENLSP